MEYAIRVSHVTKSYKLYESNKNRLREAVCFWKKEKFYKEFKALNDVSFNIARGDIVGIIGTNGAGKSTVLKIISGILQPDEGTVTVNGRISALLELGAGFNMEYSGVENIRLNGMMLGLDEKEIEEKIPDILQFAEIGDFAYQPVKTYSSGMFARLAFAVSINVKPDILIIDEALSVGDMYFQEKCYEMMKKMVKSGSTILFVSHSLPAVRNFCRKAIWLDGGKVRKEGNASDICNEYKSFIEKKVENEAAATPAVSTGSQNEEAAVKERNKVFIKKVELNKTCYYMDEDINLSVELGYHADDLAFGVGVIIRNNKGEIVTLFNTVRDDIIISEKLDHIDLSIPKNDFTEGSYCVSVNICDDQIMYPLDREDDVCSFEILPTNNRHGVPIAEGHFRQKHVWNF